TPTSLDYPLSLHASLPISGYSANVETMDRFYQANMDMLDRSKFNSLFYTSQPILTKTKNGVPSYYDNDSKVTESIIGTGVRIDRSEEHTSELQSRVDLVCR